MKNQQVVGILYGWIIALSLILVASLFIALFLQFTSFNEPSLSWITLFAGLISLFVSGLIAGIKGKNNGWIIGAITGIGFTLFTFSVQYLAYNQGFSIQQGLHHLAYIGSALFGGMFGVNLITTKKD